MMRFLKSLRGAIGMGVTWALAWFAAGFVVGPFLGPIGDDVPSGWGASPGWVPTAEGLSIPPTIRPAHEAQR